MAVVIEHDTKREGLPGVIEIPGSPGCQTAGVTSPVFRTN
jgi:hypothetical protein